MKFIKFSKLYILKIERGEKINKTIEEFSQKEAKNGGFFLGIGATKEVTLAYYDLKKKKYHQRKIKKPLELASLIGNVCFEDGKIIIHSHAVLADKNLKTFSGHLVEASVSGACEIIFFPFSRKIHKAFDKATGLKLMKF